MEELAKAVIASGPECFAEFWIEIYRNFKGHETEKLMPYAIAMADKEGRGRLHIFEKICDLIKYQKSKIDYEIKDTLLNHGEDE